MDSQFFQLLKKKHHIDLNPQQQAAVLHKNGPSLILAVPGGGKTTTLLARTAYLILEQNVNPRHILSITFSRASANDMKNRFKTIFSGQLEAVTFSTIHSFSYRVIMSYYKERGVQLRLIEGGNAGKWSKPILLRNLFLKYNKEYSSENDLDTLMNDISYVKNSMYNEEELKTYKSTIDSFLDIYLEYEKIKKENYCIDFDDMLVQCYQILNTQKELLKAYQKRFRYVQVDEAQDTSILQHKIIYLLVKEHQNVFYVADDDQSIYGFRAACPSYLLDMEKHYAKAVIYRMEQNYRSTKSIVTLCNQFIKKNTKRYDKNIFTENLIGDPIRIIEVESKYMQMKYIIDEIKACEYGEIAVLYRNNQSAIMMAKTFAEKRIPFYLREFKNRFFTHWVVKDILSILDFAINPRSLVDFSKFYYRLKGYYISKQMIDYCSQSEEETVFDSLKVNNSLTEYQQKNIEKLERNFRILSEKIPTVGIDYLLDVMGYREFLMDRASQSDATYDIYMDMVTILKSLGHDSKNLDELRESIKSLEKIMKEASKNEDANAVTLTTIHSSKGLEWDQVYLIDLQEGVFPNRDVMKMADNNELEGLEEERRLFYVAMTRAKNHLNVLKIKGINVSLFTSEVESIMYPEKEIEPYKKGANILHQQFGVGVVKSCDKKQIVISFDDKERVLSFEYCLKEGLFSEI